MAIGRAGGDIGAVDLVESSRERIVRDITINSRDSDHGQQIVNRLKRVTGVRVVNTSDRGDRGNRRWGDDCYKGPNPTDTREHDCSGLGLQMTSRARSS